MQYLLVVMVLPAIYVTFLTFRWLYTKERNKNKRVHFTKKAIGLLLLSIVLIYLSSRLAFAGLGDKPGQSFWLNAIIYLMSVAIITGYFYIVVKATRSRKNITKFLVILLTISLYAPAAWWGYQIFNVGVYGGKLGVTKNLAQKLTSDYVGSKINHSFKSIKKQSGYWLVTETLRTLDSKAEIDVDYKVALNGGAVSNAYSTSKVPFEIARSNGTGDSIEMMLFIDESDDPKVPKWKSLEYSNTGTNGKTELSIIPGSSLKYYVQMRDCSFSCQDYFFKLSAPIKDSYKVKLDGSQANLVEI